MKELTLAQAHELMRRELWCNVVSRTASASDCKESGVAVSWANKILKEFDLKFDALREPI